MTRFWAVLAAMSLPAVAFALAPATPSAHAEGLTAVACHQSLPAATDGHFVVDRTSVRPGESAIGVLSDFQQWPQAVLAGSGETFESCTPWQNGESQVMFHDAAALFLIPVPAGTHAGTYEVSVMFYQGSTGPMDYTQAVHLTASITVGDTTGKSSVCALDHAAATAGTLGVPASVQAGDDLRVSMTGVQTIYLNEYDHLYFVACLDGYATTVTYPGTALPRSSSEFTVPVPANLEPGTYKLVVTSVINTGPADAPVATVVEWQHSVAVRERAAVTPTPAPSESVQPTEPPLAVTGSDTDPWLAVGVSGVLIALGVGVILAARGRRATGH